VTRLRWLSVKLVLVFVPLLLAAALVGLIEALLINVQGSQANRWAFFDQQAPVTVAVTFFALALGVAAGAVVRRSIPAMAVTLIGFVIVRVGLAVLARPQYIAPARLVSHDLAAPYANPTAWYLDNGSYYDSAGHLLKQRRPTVGPQFSYFIQTYQPADRFWAFQTIESAILSGLAILILGFAIYWVTRRTS
jgi:ABC-type xylose transport system permease subunit